MNIVITGQGIISALGVGVHDTLLALQERRTGIGTMRHLPSTHHELPVGEVHLDNEQMKASLGIDPTHEVSRTALMGMMAVREALQQAGLPCGDEPKCHMTLISGTTVGGMDITERHYATFGSSDTHLDNLLQHECGASTELMARHFGFFHDCTTISTACSSAANAIILGARLIEAGDADIVVAGGSEALTCFHLNGFNSLQILDHKPCRPFDAERAGLNLGEGAAFVVLEREEAARRRQAHILGYLSGYGNACDAFHQTASSDAGEGAYLAMNQALETAGLRPCDIGYVNAHGTATPNNDQSESMALKRIFGQAMPPVSSTKGFTGHATSAAGGIEAVISLLALQHGFVPANLGWAHPMCDGITPSMGVEHCPLDHVMCNSFGFGGNDSSLVFSRHSHAHVERPLLPDAEVKVLSQVTLTDEAQLADIRQYVKPMEARRMGRLIKAALLTSLQALEQAGIDCPDAIITATARGCLDNSERLLDQLRDEGEVLLKPTLFMQSTHNTIGSAIAIHLGCHGYNVTYSHGDRSLEWALRDARLLLRSGLCRTVLVGLHDEATPLYRSFIQRMGGTDLPAINAQAIVLSCGS